MGLASTPGAEGPPEEVIKIVGCAHYKRKSKFVTPCCQKVYTCRFCHDEKEDHTMNRKEVTELICTVCEARQPVQADCRNCGVRFGKYVCLECNLFDDEEKNQFHCQGCGICRIGGADRFFHCKKCNMCLPVQLKNGHKCVENVSRSNCPVCLEDIHTSRIPCHIPMCGHLLHRTCFEQLLQAGHYACPICQTSLMDMSQLWKYLDEQVASTPMPPEYKDYIVYILCKDCHKIMENAEKTKTPTLVVQSSLTGADLPSENSESFPELCKRENTEHVTSESDVPKKNKENMYVKFAVIFVKKVLILVLGYIFCYFNWSLTLPILGIISLIWYENLKPTKGERIQKKIWASSMSKSDIFQLVKDLPSWVNFPDRERAEWLNEIIAQLWPNLNSYIVKYCRSKIQANIRKKFDSFRFEDIDFGNTPPKIDGIKVYNQSLAKDSIIIDFEVFYDGDCDVNFSMSGTQIGTIKDFQMGVEIRMVLKPLLFKMPLIGGIQLFFLNVPDIEFELEGITGIPGFSYLVRQKIEEIIKKKLVFPNKITKKFSKTIEAAELRSIEAEGVLRVHVFEARDLEKKDVTGKSDPYVILHVGAQELKTQVIKRDLNPQWDYYCEFIILDPEAQQLYFKLFDQDEFREDDFLGSGAVDISQVIKEGKSDQWFNLENAKHGKIHLRFSWLGLTCDRNAVNLATQETKLLKIENLHTGLLTIYIDSATNLPKIKFYKKPDPYIILTVGNNQTKSHRKRHTCNPIWEQGFYLLVKNPETDTLIITITDKHSESTLDKMVYNIRDLFDKPAMQISKKEFELQLNSESKLIMSLQLRILHNELFEAAESDSDSDLDDCTNSASRRKSSVRAAKEIQQVDPPSLNLPEQEIVETFKKSEVAAANASMVQKPTFLQRPEERGRIELTLDYSGTRQKLLVTVHRIVDLPQKNPSDIPDPYVKLRLEGPGISPIKNRTKVVVDSCNPEYENTFEYLLSVSELPAHRLIVTVKNKKIFNSSILGQMILELGILETSGYLLRDWFDLHEQEVSD